MTSVVTFTEAGGHPANEDAFLVRPHKEGWLGFLADGQGGRADMAGRIWTSAVGKRVA